MNGEIGERLVRPNSWTRRSCRLNFPRIPGGTADGGPLSHDTRHIKQPDLSAGSAVGGIDGDELSIVARTGMGVAPPFAGIMFREMEVREIVTAMGRLVIEIGRLVTMFAGGIGVIEDPLFAIARC